MHCDTTGWPKHCPWQLHFCESPLQFWLHVGLTPVDELADGPTPLDALLFAELAFVDVANVDEPPAPPDPSGPKTTLPPQAATETTIAAIPTE